MTTLSRVVGTWQRTTAKLLIAGLGVLIAGGAAAAAAPARLSGIGPAPLGTYAFAGSLSSVPLKPTDIKLTKPQCSTLTLGAPVDCQVKLDLAVKDREIFGSLNDPARGITGKFNASCDFTGNGTAAFQAAKQQIEITKIDASSGSQRCDWSANLSNGGRIAGTLEGTKLGFAFSGGANPVADLTTSMRLSIVGGSGAFNGVRGSGIVDQNLRVALPLLTLDSAVDKAINAAFGGLGGWLT